MNSPAVSTTLKAPSVRRRLTCMVYEGLLLFGLAFAAGLIFDLLSNSKHALNLRHARQAWIFIVFGAYFIYCWHRSGQTLPMQTWRIRLVNDDGKRLPLIKAVVRYLLAWLWVLPGMAIGHQLGLKEWAMLAPLSVSMLAWASTAKFSPDGQFLHDILAKTRLIELPVTKSDKDL